MEENRPSLILVFKSLPILNSYKIKDIISNIEKLNKEVEITLDVDCQAKLGSSSNLQKNQFSL